MVKLANGRVIQISPDFNSINVWEPGAWEKSERPYCCEKEFSNMIVDMGGENG